MKTTGAIITEILETVGGRMNEWTRIADIAQSAGLTPEEINEGIMELLGDEEFRAEPEPFGHRTTEADKIYGPVIGGEQRHLIKWGA